MSNLSDKNELREFLTQVGCCRICVLRYQKPLMDEFLKVINLKDQDEQKQVNKKFKANACVTCFGIFDLIDELIKKIVVDNRLKQYEFTKFLTSFSLPLSLNLAQLQMWLTLVEKFPNLFDKRNEPDVAVKDTLKHIMNERIANETGKLIHMDGMMISMTFVHDDEKELFDKLATAIPERMKEWNNRKFKREKNELMSRGYFEKNFNPETVNIIKFKKFLPSPPKVPASSIRVDKIDFTGPTVFLAGRYCKYSRKLSQTPWVVDGKRLTEGSVEDIIVDAVLPHFKVPIASSDTTVTFMSSGREDVDVRCLGKGRPFALEIVNPIRENLKLSTFISIENEVRKSSLISIRDLQMVHRNELHHIKTGEEEKRKFYRALCILRDENVSVEILEKLQINEPFEIQQWTPLRVLHRRSLLKRPRTIYSVKAFALKDKPNQLVLDIVTQAGTYVKELVHGEFNRTWPSIATIIEKSIDITSLDVMNIDLNFPPSTNR